MNCHLPVCISCQPTLTSTSPILLEQQYDYAILFPICIQCYLYHTTSRLYVHQHYPHHLTVLSPTTSSHCAKQYCYHCAYLSKTLCPPTLPCHFVPNNITSTLIMSNNTRNTANSIYLGWCNARNDSKLEAELLESKDLASRSKKEVSLPATLHQILCGFLQGHAVTNCRYESYTFNHHRAHSEGNTSHTTPC